MGLISRPSLLTFLRSHLMPEPLSMTPEQPQLRALSAEMTPTSCVRASQMRFSVTRSSTSSSRSLNLVMKS